MITTLLYDDKKQEIEQLNIILRSLAAKLTDESWNYQSIGSMQQLENFLVDKPLVDMFLYDVMKAGDIDKLIRIRGDYQLSHLLLIADATMSPMKYIRPGINAQSLLLRPFDRQQAYETLSDFVTEYLKVAYSDKSDDRPAMIIDSESGKVSIPYDQIYYIEAMDKKVYVCTGAEEYGFYDTLDGLVNSLPEQFLRCHRSFIVSKDKIKKVALSQNTIYLKDDFEVPLSRSYKAAFKGVFDGN